MAKKKGPSKSAAIREYLKGNRKASAKEVDAMKTKGWEVTEGLAYAQKGRIKGREIRRKEDHVGSPGCGLQRRSGCPDP